MGYNPFEAYLPILDTLRDEGRLRRIPPDRTPISKWLDLSSNDYLGIAMHRDDLRSEFDALRCPAPLSSSASRLLCSHQQPYEALEELLSHCYMGKGVLLFNSGYHANVGVTTALNIPGTIFLSDKLIHASVIDGLSRRGMNFDRWRHNDTAHLRKLLEKYSPQYDRMIVVAESVYSMDGDCCPLPELIELKREFPKMILYLDEAHAVGCFGEQGLGLAEELGVTDSVDIIVGTFGKAVGSAGAFVAVPPAIREYLLNTSRSFIFSTAMPPYIVAWTEFIMRRILHMRSERERLREISAVFRQRIEEITDAPCCSRSQIVPLIIGDAKRTVAISERLMEDHVIALPIRRPTVPPGGERIRFSLCSTLTDNDLDRAFDAITNALKTL